jgi:hypothetical protein
MKPTRASSPGLLKILSSVRPCTDTFGRKALAFLVVKHFQRVKKRDLIGVARHYGSESPDASFMLKKTLDGPG